MFFRRNLYFFNFKKKIFIFLNLSIFFYFLFSPAYLSLRAEETFEVPFDPKSRIVVRGFFGNLHIIETQKSLTSGESLKLKLSLRSKNKSIFHSKLFSSSNFFITREDSTIYVTHSPDALRKSLENNLTKKVDKKDFLDLKIEGPSVPLEIYMRHADIKVFSWSSSLRFTQMSGKIQTENTKGSLSVYVQKGHVNIEKHRGPIELDGYQLDLHLKNIKGYLKFENFLGPLTKITSFSGSMDINSYKGDLELSSIRGSVRFNHKDSNLTINDLWGELKGKSGQGNIKAILRQNVSVSIQTKNGDVQLRAPNSGASVRLSSLEGYIVAPKYLKRVRAYGQYRSGRLRGAHSGRIVVKSQKGNIKLR